MGLDIEAIMKEYINSVLQKSKTLQTKRTFKSQSSIKSDVALLQSPTKIVQKDQTDIVKK